VRPIATTGLKRTPVYKDLPTVDEAGLKGFEVDLWLGIFGPTGMPADVVNKLNSELVKILKKPDLIEALAKVGVEPNGTSPQDGEKFLKTEYEKWKKVIADGNIKPQ
jgi:tripartite-type tricarboxylate transporter receptor subunit TctC